MELLLAALACLALAFALACLLLARSVIREAGALHQRFEDLRVRLEALERRLSANGRQAAGALVLWVASAMLAPGQQPAPLSPADAVALAAADLRTLSPALQVTTRYLTTFAVPEKDRPTLNRVLSFHCNGLSREADIVAPFVVPGTRESLLRLNLLDYDWSPATWDKLFDPVFHTRIVETVTPAVVVTPKVEWWPGGVWPQDGKFYPARSFTYEVPAKAAAPVAAKKTAALAPWLPTVEATALVNATQSSAPIVRGSWFLWQTAIQADRGGVGYYEWLGIKDQKSFEALIGFDAKLQKSARRVELLEAVATSTVTLQPRRIGAFPAISGTFWATFDSRQAVDEHNPLRILNGGFRFDATEVFGHLPNGHLAWGLFDEKGTRQDSAPDFIASDATAPGTDRRVHAGASCVRCHLPNAGINPVDGWARNLFTGPLKLQSPDHEKLRDLRQKYLRDLEGPMEDSRRTYTRAIAQATGMKPPELGLAYGAAFARYDAPVTLERAAADAGVTPERLDAALKHYIRGAGSLDLVAAAFISKKKGGMGVVQYHECVPTLHLALRGYLTP